MQDIASEKILICLSQKSQMSKKEDDELQPNKKEQFMYKCTYNHAVSDKFKEKRIVK